MLVGISDVSGRWSVGRVSVGVSRHQWGSMGVGGGQWVLVGISGGFLWSFGGVSVEFQWSVGTGC